MKTVVCDIDGPVANLFKEWIGRYNKAHDDNVTEVDVDDRYTQTQSNG